MPLHMMAPLVVQVSELPPSEGEEGVEGVVGRVGEPVPMG